MSFEAELHLQALVRGNDEPGLLYRVRFWPAGVGGNSYETTSRVSYADALNELSVLFQGDVAAAFARLSARALEQ